MTTDVSGQSTWTRRLVPDHHCLCAVCYLGGFLWCVIRYMSNVLEILSVYTFILFYLFLLLLLLLLFISYIMLAAVKVKL